MTDSTPIYNLKAVIQETGLGPETLRAWERRYGLVKPQRSPGGHRIYSQYDIDILKWLVARQKEGLSISRAVEMWRGLVKDGQDPLQQFHTPLKTLDTGGSMLDDLRNGWIAACLAFDEQAAERALSQAFAIVAPEIACTEVIQKGLAEIGERWYQSAISVQQEHFASSLAMLRISALFIAAPPPTRAERILAACPPGEEHDFVLLLAAFLLRRRGWDVVYLGANVPLSRLAETIQQISPRLVLSIAQTLNSAAALREMAGYVYARGVPLAYGGGIFNAYPALTHRVNGYFLGSEISTLPQVVDSLLMRQPALPMTNPITPEYTRALAKFVEKEALIVASVTRAMQLEQLEPAHLENANMHFSHNIVSALSLGEVDALDLSVSWLEGLLGNYGMSPLLAVRYFNAYRQAVQQHLGSHESALLLDWLLKFLDR
jgi:DNA-binding transcriptional MerR regulator